MPCSHSCVTGVLTRPFLRGIFRRFLNGCANSSPLMHADGRHSLFICLEGPDAAEDMMVECSTEHVPWFIIPSNHTWFRNLAISKIVAEKLDSLEYAFQVVGIRRFPIRKRGCFCVMNWRPRAEGIEGRFLWDIRTYDGRHGIVLPEVCAPLAVGLKPMQDVGTIGSQGDT